MTPFLLGERLRTFFRLEGWYKTDTAFCYHFDENGHMDMAHDCPYIPLYYKGETDER